MTVNERDAKLLNPVQAVQTTLVAAAAGDYADNDVISNAVTNGTGVAEEFALAVRVPGGAGKVVGASIACSATSMVATTELQLFSQAPTATELDDNAAAGNVGAADLPYYLGLIAFAAMATGWALPATLTPAAPLLVHAAPGSQSIFSRLIFRDAETNEAAGMTFTITLYIE